MKKRHFYRLTMIHQIVVEEETKKIVKFHKIHKEFL